MVWWNGKQLVVQQQQLDNKDIDEDDNKDKDMLSLIKGFAQENQLTNLVKAIPEHTNAYVIYEDTMLTAITLFKSSYKNQKEVLNACFAIEQVILAIKSSLGIMVDVDDLNILYRLRICHLICASFVYKSKGIHWNKIKDEFTYIGPMLMNFLEVGYVTDEVKELCASNFQPESEFVRDILDHHNKNNKNKNAKLIRFLDDFDVSSRVYFSKILNILKMSHSVLSILNNIPEFITIEPRELHNKDDMKEYILINNSTVDNINDDDDDDDNNQVVVEKVIMQSQEDNDANNEDIKQQEEDIMIDDSVEEASDFSEDDDDDLKLISTRKKRKLMDIQQQNNQNDDDEIIIPKTTTTHKKKNKIVKPKLKIIEKKQQQQEEVKTTHEESSTTPSHNKKQKKMKKKMQTASNTLDTLNIFHSFPKDISDSMKKVYFKEIKACFPDHFQKIYHMKKKTVKNWMKK